MYLSREIISLGCPREEKEEWQRKRDMEAERKGDRGKETERKGDREKGEGGLPPSRPE